MTWISIVLAGVLLTAVYILAQAVGAGRPAARILFRLAVLCVCLFLIAHNI